MVREAGALALTFAHKGFRRWRKADGTPVTVYVDSNFQFVSMS